MDRKWAEANVASENRPGLANFQDWIGDGGVLAVRWDYKIQPGVTCISHLPLQ